MSMLCEKCKKNDAVSHFTKIINGVKTEGYLCAECAKTEGLFSDLDFGYGIPSLFSSPLFSAGKSVEEKACPMCKSTLSEISRIGKVGCSKCYETFREELMPYITRIHGRAEYKGDTRKKVKADPVRQLKEELSEAVKREDFEKACKLRDKIRRLEGEKDEKKQ